MCLSIPGKIVSIDKSSIVIDYGSEKRKAEMSVVDVELGDYVIVSNKIIISKLDKEKAKKMLEVMK